MTENNAATRPEVMENLTESQLQELELQASEYDQTEFMEIASNYGWDSAAVKSVWNWFEVQNTYPLDGTDKS